MIGQFFNVIWILIRSSISITTTTTTIVVVVGGGGIIRDSRDPITTTTVELFRPQISTRETMVVRHKIRIVVLITGGVVLLGRRRRQDASGISRSGGRLVVESAATTTSIPHDKDIVGWFVRKCPSGGPFLYHCRILGESFGVQATSIHDRFQYFRLGSGFIEFKETILFVNVLYDGFSHLACDILSQIFVSEGGKGE